MKTPPPLSSTFLEHARVRLTTPSDPAELEHLLSQATETARAQWPQVIQPAEQFVRHLAQRLPKASDGQSVDRALKGLHLAELHLACACVQGLPAAIAVLDGEFLARLPERLRRNARLTAAVIDEVCQMVRVKLLVGTPESGPQIAEYEGRGPLLNWLLVMAARLAERLLASDKPSTEDDVIVALDSMQAPGDDAELELLKRRYGEAYRQAVHDAFSALSTDNRYVLKLYYVKGLSTPKLGELLGVHSSTISRRLESIRQQIFDKAKRLLRERLRISSGEFNSLLSLLRSQLDIAISQIFERPDRNGGEPE